MANTYLQRTASGTDTTYTQKRNTISMWLKRSSLSDACFIEGQGNDANATQAYFDSNTNLTINHVSSNASLNFQIVTNKKFRDSAWYHFVITIDTTLGTAADRVKIYVNGVRETSFASASYPGQNETTQLLANGNLNIIGRRKSGGVGLYFDGSMSHVHVTDGTVYQASTFGSTDSTTGEWKINTSPSFTPGNLGFTILKDGNTITDQSANSNNFSLGGGTLTNTKDCPSNVFNVFSDTTSKKAYTSEAGLKVSETATSWNLGVGGTIGASSGKYYWEFYKTANSDNFIAGIIPSAEFHRLAESTAAAVYNAANGIQIGASSSYYYKIGTGDSTQISGFGHGSGSKSSGLFQFALDLTNKKMWIGKDGTWYNSGNPATGANPLWTGSAVFPDDIYVPYWQGYGTVSGRFNFGGGSFGSDAVASAGTNASGNGVFELDVPSGYSALSTKGLNT